ncbi:MAG: ATP-binding protein [Bacteroidetes bacterium]|nr:ATP-binding protein [Bacteroidota bacterium]
METPFVFGKLASGDDFTNRKEEIKRLKTNFGSGTNTVIISPRRWGKSSLVEKTAKEFARSAKKIRFIFLDLFNIRTDEEFYKLLAEQVVRATSTRIEELQSITRKFFRQWVPRISFSPDHVQEISLGLNWEEVKKQPDEILDLPQNIAKEKGWKIVICLDEFQNIGFYEDNLAFQKKLRSHWQRHQDVSYCIYGSRRHMLMDVFTSPTMPLYKFGDLIFLEKIGNRDWQGYIVERFRETGKRILPEQASHIATLVENHPFYVQQLAQLCWLRCTKEMTDSVIEEALEGLILQLGLLFQNLTESLPTGQLRFLEAMCNGESRFSTREVIQSYRLATSANVNRVKSALISKEIIDNQGTGFDFVDPIYKLWLKRVYFRTL